MGAAVGQAGDRVRVLQHLGDGVEVAVGVVGEGEVEHRSTVAGGDDVVGQLFWCHAELALPDWQALCDLAAALVARSADHFEGWGDVVIFAARTAGRIGEVSGIRCADIDCDT